MANITDEEYRELKHYAAVGRLASAWEYLKVDAEVFLLELAGCNDPKSRILTERMQFIGMMKAIRKLIKHAFGDDAVGRDSEFHCIAGEVEELRTRRNEIIHAVWAEIDTSSSPATAVLKRSNPLESVDDDSYTASEIVEFAERVQTVHVRLVNLMLDLCGHSPLHDRLFELARG